MIGANAGFKLSIEVCDSPEFFTNGEYVHGTITIESSKAFSLHNIEAKLRCDERASVWVTHSQGGHYEVETVRRLSMKSIVFPTRDIQQQQQSEEATYTLQSGTHKFDFQFQIPISNAYPSSLEVAGSQSYIRWYLKGVVHRGNMLTMSKRASTPITFVAAPSRPSLSNEMMIAQCEAAMTVFLPAYSEIAKTPAGKLRGLLSSSQFKTRSNVRLTATLPAHGVIQHPVPLCIELDIGSDYEELLLLRSAKLYLKQKIIVSVANSWHTSVYRDTISLWDSPVFNLPMKQGLKAVHDQIMDICVNGKLYETFSNVHFSVQYKLVAEVVVACREKRSSTMRLRLSIPVTLHNFLSGHAGYTNNILQSGQEPLTELPTYAAQPHAGEATVESFEMKG